MYAFRIYILLFIVSSSWPQAALDRYALGKIMLSETNNEEWARATRHTRHIRAAEAATKSESIDNDCGDGGGGGGDGNEEIN